MVQYSACKQKCLKAFAFRDSDTQCDSRNSDNISPFLLVILFH